jgi:hypothetical protein
MEARAKPFSSRPLLLNELQPLEVPASSVGNWTLLDDVQDLGSTEVHVRLPLGHQDGWLYLADADYPGWTAAVDGQSRPILRAEIAFRAVHVLAAEKEAIFRFRPVSFYMGLGISLLSLLFLIWPGLFKPLFRT